MASWLADVARRHFLPPSATEAITRRLVSGSNRVTGNYATYEAALSGLPAPLTWSSDRYLEQREGAFEQQRRGIEAMEALSIRAQARLFGLLFPLTTSGRPRQLRVLDFGGGFGLDYVLARRALPAAVAIDWRVVETADLAARAARLHADAEISYVDDISALPPTPFDVAHVADTIQYLPDPRTLAVLLGELDCAAVVIADAPVTNRSDDRIAIQSVRRRGARYAHPIRLFGRDSLPSLFAPAFSHAATLRQHGGLIIDGRMSPNTGYVFLRRTAASDQGED